MNAPSPIVSLKNYLRLGAAIFLVLVCTTAAMIATSFSQLGWTLKVTLILAIAVVNAFLVTGYLMHLLSEKRLVYLVLGFTVIFFLGLLGLTVWAAHDVPTGGNDQIRMTNDEGMTKHEFQTGAANPFLLASEFWFLTPDLIRHSSFNLCP